MHRIETPSLVEAPPPLSALDQYWFFSSEKPVKRNRSSFQIQRGTLREDSMNGCICMNDFEMM